MVITPNSLHAVERVSGFSIAEDAGAAAHVRFRKGSVSGSVVWNVKLASGQSATLDLGGESRSFEGGVYVEEVSGSIEGALLV